MLYEWYIKCCQAGIYHDRAMLQEEALKTELNDSNSWEFKASNGWSEPLKKAFWFKADKNSWKSKGCTYNYHQGLDGATSRNYSRLFC